MLITLFVTTYNRAYCIEKTLDAILALPIPDGVEVEYLWSDDCSTDGTFEIMQRKAKKYAENKRILLNRNEVNLKLGLHLQKVGELGHGEWFIECDSDDIPRSNRILDIWDCIQKYPHMRGYSSGMQIWENGKEKNYSGIQGHQFFPCGATCAWHRDCFKKFPLAKEQTISQDVFLPFRALLLGGEWVFSDIPTINYTIDENNESTPKGLKKIESLRHLIKIKKHLVMAVRQRLHDLSEVPAVPATAREILEKKHRALIDKLEKDIENLHFMTEYLSSEFFRKISLLTQIPPAVKQRRFFLAKLLVNFFPCISGLASLLQPRKSRTAMSDVPSHKRIIIDLNFLVDNPDTFLIWL